jgi:hypothetical protein
LLYRLPLPNGYQGLDITSVVAGQTVGVGTGIAPNHAFIWNGPTGAVVDLTPPGFTYSDAYDTNGVQQVGDGSASNFPNDPPHALLWTGNASSAVDLNPPGYYGSSADGISGSGNQQVGYGGVSNYGNTNALVW